MAKMMKIRFCICGARPRGEWLHGGVEMEAFSRVYRDGINRRCFIKGGVIGMLGLWLGNCVPMGHAFGALENETLYNGIRLPSPWPPSEQSDPRKPAPYLVSPPKVIPIDVGRQLLVDDFLIESTTLKRTYHLSKNYGGNPVLQPSKEWENKKVPKAGPFPDGVWYDPREKLFKVWYMAGLYPRDTCYATSEDGIHWHKPELDVVPGTNIVMPTDGDRRDYATIWLDLNESDPERRYKMFQVMHYVPGGMADSRFSLFFSGDGIHWKRIVKTAHRIRGESTSVFYNPFRKVWVYNIRHSGQGSQSYWTGRHTDYQEDVDPVRGTQNIEKSGRIHPWIFADDLDPRPLGVACQLYSLNCVAYESIILGLFDIYRGEPSGVDKPKWVDVCLGYTRDGYYWTRPDRRAFAALSDNSSDWNYGYVHSVGGGCLVMGDMLYFYMHGTSARLPDEKLGVGYTGLVTLRRDGFASMDAGSVEGRLTTRPVRFSGVHKFVNVDCDKGELRVEILDSQNKVIAPFSRDNCIPIKVNRTLQEVQWRGVSDLSRVAGKTVKFRFYLTNGRLYAFWVSPTPNGASHGYVAAGGPGFTAHTDTVGADGYPS
jgi:hypothetical protein